MNNSSTRTASCVCGNLKAVCSGDPASVSLCNCLDCQKRSGSTFGIAAFFDRSRVQTSGSSSRFCRRSDEDLDFCFHFCPDCGATVYWEITQKPDLLAIAAGSFADPEFPAPAQSVFEQHKHPWLKFSI